MPEPATSLSQHLLTRSDLARIGVPAASILAWLANAWLDQVGSLPGEGRAGDPVFAVSNRDLRRELAGQLAAIGKDAIVFSPARVRSLLLRAMISGGAAPAVSGDAGILPAALALPETTAPRESPQCAPNPSTPDDAAIAAVPEALQATAQMLAGEVDAFLAMARQEARLDAMELTAHAEEQAPVPAGDPAPDAPSTSDDTEEEPDEIEEVPDDTDFFDADDLAGELDSWGQPEAPAAAPAAAPQVEAEGSITEPESTAEPESQAEDPIDAITAPRPMAEVVAVAEAEPAPLEPAATFAEPEPTAEPALHAEDPIDAITAPRPMAEVVEDEPSLPPAVPSASFDEPAVAHAPAREPEPTLAAAFGEPTQPDGDLAPAPDTPAQHTMQDAAIEEALAAPEPATTAPSAPAAPTERTPAAAGADADGTAAALAMGRVESFLGELRSALVELASKQPPTPTIDVQPLVATIQTGLAQAQERAAATDGAIASLAERIDTFGSRVEVGVALAVRAALERAPQPESVPERPTHLVVQRTERSTLALLGIGFLLLCWTAIFWWKTDNARLALTTLIGANLIGCCLLAGRRSSP